MRNGGRCRPRLDSRPERAVGAQVETAPLWRKEQSAAPAALRRSLLSWTNLSSGRPATRDGDPLLLYERTSPLAASSCPIRTTPGRPGQHQSRARFARRSERLPAVCSRRRSGDEDDRIPVENDGLRWPRRDGLKWPHPSSVVVLV